VILLALVLTASGELALKERARVEGRFVRLADVVRGDAPADVWLGRAPEEGRTRAISADDVRRELALRGYALEIVGTEVVVERGAEPAEDAARRAAAFEIKRVLLERDALRPDELAVAVDGPLPAGEIAGARAEGDAFVLTYADGSTARVAARVRRLREVAFARRDIPPGRVLGAEDVELRRAPDGVEDAVGATATTRIAAGAAISASDVRLKPAVRKGDVVRFTSTAFEVDGRALEDGAPGREIEVEIAGTKSKARGRVAGPGRVEAK
jgi:flagella basal body P-ring formation protein FlgA